MADDPTKGTNDADPNSVDDTKPDDDAAKDDADPDGSDQLGDAGKKALDAMKAKWRKERDDAKALRDELTALKTPPAKPDEAPDLDAIRKQVREEAAAEGLKEKALDKAVVKAAKRLENPEDARAFLAGRVDEFIDGTKLDMDAIEDALKDLISERPYLTPQGAGKFTGSADGGTRNGSSSAQITDADLSKMTPDQIVAARKEGRLAHFNAK